LTGNTAITFEEKKFRDFRKFTYYRINNGKLTGNNNLCDMVAS